MRAVETGRLLQTAFASLDELPAEAKGFDKFFGDPNSRNGVTLNIRPTGGVRADGTPYEKEVTVGSGNGPPEVAYQFNDFDYHLASI